MGGRSTPFMVGAVIAAWMFVWPTEASAYLDPGTGSMVFQATVGLLLAGVAVFRLYWGKVSDFMRRKAKRPPSQ